MYDVGVVRPTFVNCLFLLMDVNIRISQEIHYGLFVIIPVVRELELAFSVKNLNIVFHGLLYIIVQKLTR